MPSIKRPRQGDEISVPLGANLMTSLQNVGIPVASSCGGDAVCGKCTLKVLSGGENLTSPTDDELFLVEKDSIASGLRVSCQCQVQGDVEVDAPYW